MATKSRKRKQKKPRDLIVLGMILTRKGGPMRDRREKRNKDKIEIFKRLREEDED